MEGGGCAATVVVQTQAADSVVQEVLVFCGTVPEVASWE